MLSTKSSIQHEDSKLCASSELGRARPYRDLRWEPPPAVAGIVAVPPVPIDPPRPTFKPCDRLPDDLAGDCWMRADEREARRIEGELTRLKNEAVRLADEIWRTLKRQANIGGGDG
ncbi:MAG: hypothetical protein K0S35_3707 [Geminicoccaceae bacterium]|nr:hypothetical protein [Geminicoccaceae bacterium]